MNILVTGHCGLIGTELCQTLRRQGHRTIGLDLLGEGHEQGDTRKACDIARAIESADGVIHLAAVSRVVDAERYGSDAWLTNLGGTMNVVSALKGRWMVFASSREVYGQVEPGDPVSASRERAPINVYGTTKATGECLVSSVSNASIVRLSNAYGSVTDHATRVIPAFIRAAIAGQPLMVEGAERTFDFVSARDAACGLARVASLVSHNIRPKACHLTTGVGTTLLELARMVVALSGSNSPIVEAPGRDYDAKWFVGDTSEAKHSLGWSAEVQLQDGLARLIADFKNSPGLAVSFLPASGEPGLFREGTT